MKVATPALIMLAEALLRKVPPVNVVTAWEDVVRVAVDDELDINKEEDATCGTIISIGFSLFADIN